MQWRKKAEKHRKSFEMKKLLFKVRKSGWHLQFSALGGRLQFQGLGGGWRAAALAANSATLHRLPVLWVDVLCRLLQKNLYPPT
jgi:hypothetical protein